MLGLRTAMDDQLPPGTWPWEVGVGQRWPLLASGTPGCCGGAPRCRVVDSFR
jgi:hypothetical protein